MREMKVRKMAGIGGELGKVKVSMRLNNFKYSQHLYL
jgi:hypothetical protein